MLMRTLDLLLLDPKRSLFTINTTIKNSNSRMEEMMGTGQRWHVVERREEMDGTTP
jgi:hypothetical protein